MCLRSIPLLHGRSGRTAAGQAYVTEVPVTFNATGHPSTINRLIRGLVVPGSRLAVEKANVRGARALLYPQHEDFGLVAVEAQAAGRPVIGFGRGGLLDTVVPLSESDGASPVDATGVYFEEQTPEALCEAIERFEKFEARFDPRALRRWAERFSPARFDRAFDAELAIALGETRAARPLAPSIAAGGTA